MSNLRRTTASGVGWLTVQSVGSRVISFAAQLVLARLLAPAQFGEFALAGTVVGLVAIIGQFGIDDVLLQRGRRFRFWTSAAFAASLAVAVIAALAIIVAAPLMARLYRAPDLRLMLILMGAALPINALTTLPATMFRAGLRFRFLALAGSLEILATQGLTVGLAAAGFGVLAFALPLPIVAILKLAVFWLKARPRFSRLRPIQLRWIAVSGLSVFASRLAIAMISQGDYFVLGFFATRSVVGVYFFSYRLAVQSIQILAGNLSTVLLPMFANLRSQPMRQLDAALDASRVLAFIVMPYCFVQAAAARPVLHILFGDKWLAAVPLIQILSIGLAFDAVSWIAGALLTSTGQFDRNARLLSARVPFFIASVVLGAWWKSALGVALGVCLYNMIFPTFYSYTIFTAFGARTRDVVGLYTWPALQAVTAVAAGVVLAQQFPGQDVMKLVVTLGVSGLAYLLLASIFARNTLCAIGSIGRSLALTAKRA